MVLLKVVNTRDFPFRRHQRLKRSAVLPSLDTYANKTHNPLELLAVKVGAAYFAKRRRVCPQARQKSLSNNHISVGLTSWSRNAALPPGTAIRKHSHTVVLVSNSKRTSWVLYPGAHCGDYIHHFIRTLGNASCSPTTSTPPMQVMPEPTAALPGSCDEDDTDCCCAAPHSPLKQAYGHENGDHFVRQSFRSESVYERNRVDDPRQVRADTAINHNWRYIR
jgi:hypothetical protein